MPSKLSNNAGNSSSNCSNSCYWILVQQLRFIQKRSLQGNMCLRYAKWRKWGTELSVSQFRSLSHVRLFGTPWPAAHQASLSITNSQSLLKLMSIALVMPSNHLLSSLSPPTFNHSQHQGLFQWVSSSHQEAKVLELQLQHQSFQWIFRIDFL